MIKIICGVYGHYTGGMVVAKDKNSAPFSLPPEREAELVALGVAAYAEDTMEETPTPIGFDEVPELPEGVLDIPEYSIDMKADELRKIGKLCGLTFKVGMSKADMVAALDAFFAEHIDDEDYYEDEEEDEDDDLEVPDFDPAEAVE